MLLSFLFITTLAANTAYHFEAPIHNSKRINVEQHPNILEYDHNECTYVMKYDDEDKSWFAIESEDGNYHFPHSTNGPSTIKYFISDTSTKYSSLTWNFNMPDSTLGEEVKQNFLSSILKWNNVYFYQQSANQFIIKKKIVNIIPGTATDYNVLIHPERSSSMVSTNSVAETAPNGSHSFQETQNSVVHTHYNDWSIALNLEATGVNTVNNNDVLNKVGAHEFGHVLGLRDIDTVEDNGNHHGEILMGYAWPNQSEITYKDLVGAAITRGYHTDLDHKWIYHSYSVLTSQFRLICSICNGVRYVNTLSNVDYGIFKNCNDCHSLNDGNMFAVASYGNKDYYKCRYCNYVKEFSGLADQNYLMTQYDSNNHLMTNQVSGLTYSFYESHVFNNLYLWRNYTQHYAACVCSTNRIEGHAVPAGSHNGGSQYVTCLKCGGLASTGFIGPLSTEELPYSENGSFVLPNGVIVLVDDDYDAYFNDTLVFNNPDISDS